MALTFPLSRADFITTLRVPEVRFFIGRQDQINGLGGGEILKAELAPALWRGSVSLVAMKPRQAAAIEAILALLETPGRAFEACRPNQAGPATDPLGVALSGFAPVIQSLDEAASTIALGGLPVGFQIKAGDLMSVAYGTNPVRQALHRFAEPGTASGLGTTDALTVTPHLRPGAAVGAAVELIRPWCKAVMIPGSVNYGATALGITRGISFQFQQSLR